VNTTEIIFIVAVVIVALVAVAFLYIRRRRSKALREDFGSEYKHAVKKYGDKRKAEEELATRKDRVSKLEIRNLSAEEQSRFSDAWRKTQGRFVDEPSRAVTEADGLVKEVMRSRGYPVGDFEQRAADISVDHPDVVTNYRTAHDIAIRNKSGKATTEELRQVMVHYRSLFEELLTQPTIHKKEAA
jgi:hypothetical protein